MFIHPLTILQVVAAFAALPLGSNAAPAAQVDDDVLVPDTELSSSADPAVSFATAVDVDSTASAEPSSTVGLEPSATIPEEVMPVPIFDNITALHEEYDLLLRGGAERKARLARRYDETPDPIYTPINHYPLSYSHTGKQTFLSWNSNSGSHFKLRMKLDYLNGKPSGGADFPTGLLTPPVDTGSSGIILAPKYIGGKANIPKLGTGTAGFQFYTSNYLLTLGVQVKLKVTISSGNSGDNAKVVATPTVLIATYQATCPDFVWSPGMTKCPGVTGNTLSDTATAPLYFGIGHGQLDNPTMSKPVQFFRNVISIDGTDVVANTAGVSGKANWLSGYYVTKTGIKVGMQNSDGCRYYKLPQNPNPGMSADWARPAGCVRIGNPSGTHTPPCLRGQILADSGIDYPIQTIGTNYNAVASPLTLPTIGSGATPSALKKGERVVVQFGNTNFPQGTFAFSLTQGSTNGATPISGDFQPSRHFAPKQTGGPVSSWGSWTNVGRKIWDATDTCTDLYGGYFGLRPR